MADSGMKKQRILEIIRVCLASERLIAFWNCIGV